MAENNIVHPDYQQGFNEGYMIAKKLPSLARKLSTATGKSDRFHGILKGIEEFEKEKAKDRLPSWLREDRLSNLDKGDDLEKDKDKGDIEKS